MFSNLFFHRSADKNKGWQSSWLSHNITWQNLSLARLVSMFPCMPILTKGWGQAVAPLSPWLWERQHRHMLQSQDLRLTMAPTQTHTDTPRRVFVSAGSHTPPYQLRRFVIVHCDDWGKVPRPSKLSYHWLIGWDIACLYSQDKVSYIELCGCSLMEEKSKSSNA